MQNQQKIIHEISLISILKVVAVLVGLWLLYVVRDVLIIILVVIVISTALDPFVNRLAKQGVPRALSVIVLYLALIVLLGFFVYFIARPVSTQIKQLTLNLPYYSDKFNQIDLSSSSSTLSSVLDSLSAKLSSAAGSFLSAIVSVFGGIVSAVTVFALTFYFLVEEDGIRKSIILLIPPQNRDKFLLTIKKVSDKLGQWLRGQLALMLIVGTLDGLALWILGINFALTLGLMSGLLEVIPIVGPIISAVIAILVAFISGVVLWKIIAIVAVYIIVQQIENSILVPKIMQRAIGLSPVIVILAIITGAKLLGIGGAVLAVPVAAGLQVLISEYWSRTRA